MSGFRNSLVQRITAEATARAAAVTAEATARSAADAAHAVLQNTAHGGIGQRGFSSQFGNAIWARPEHSSIGGPVAVAVTRGYWSQIWLPEGKIITAVAVQVSVAGAAGSLVSVDIFDDLAGVPNNRVAAMGTAAVDTLGFKSLVATPYQAVAGGAVLWLGSYYTVGTPTMYAGGVMPYSTRGADMSAGSAGGFQTSAVWPPTPPVPSPAITSVPMHFYKV